jgi:hypothetical protein
MAELCFVCSGFPPPVHRLLSWLSLKWNFVPVPVIAAYLLFSFWRARFKLLAHVLLEIFAITAHLVLEQALPILHLAAGDVDLYLDLCGPHVAQFSFCQL